MAFKFGKGSEIQLATLDPRLQRVLRRALSYGIIDFVVVVGFRGEAAQNEAFRTGASQKRWPEGEHNQYPSKAVDVALYINGKVEWGLPKSWYYLGGLIMAAAAEEGVRLRWGADWDSDRDVTDQTFNDLGHFELL